MLRDNDSCLATWCIRGYVATGNTWWFACRIIQVKSNKTSKVVYVFVVIWFLGVVRCVI